MSGTMQAVEISGAGPPEVLRLCTRPVPALQLGEVLIRVAAAGVNRPDCLQRAGGYPPPPGVSDLPGLEVAGTVVAVARDVTGPAPGDRVCALVAGGGYAEYCAAPAVQCLPVPAGFSLVEAAAIPETFFTVWTNVFERGRLQRGESLLVHGGASGIGTTAIQLGAAFGARVFATAGSDEKCALCFRLGAELAVNYRTHKFLDVLLDATKKRGIDVILDMVGGSYLPDNLRLLREDGRLVWIAALAGTKGEVNISQVFLKRLTLTGSTLRNRPPAEKGRIARALHEAVWPLFEQRSVVPVIQHVLPLAEAVEAHRILEANQAMGKVVLRMTDDP
ncbi:MAG: NAD(P)H-quinone oxidoreductase [Chromatiales bacterium]|nr:NAD(P)H-quinone oxidoreductase [Chromatiales bacterium]